ncbi:M81 family metallopeptidase [Consotaella aegiceratis]|uniref:M81 family metallopeptidase n=1 Tax=Consotaella aegiceratis TaxID=3097961 RepID=UPI002F3EC322
MASPRILIAGIAHETNSFAPGRTPLDTFLADTDFPGLKRGTDLLVFHDGNNFGTSGFLAAAEAWATLVPSVWMHGGAGAPVADEVVDFFCEAVLQDLERAGAVDGVYLDLHGAMISESHLDAEGEILRRIRDRLGEDRPIVASMDYHGNLSGAMVEALDGLAAYRTYPHTDREVAGARAAHQLQRIFQDGRPRAKSLLRGDFLIPLPFECTLVEPSRHLVAACSPLPKGVTALEYVPGFPASDAPESGPSVLAIGYDPAAVEAAAQGLHAALVAAEADFAVPVHAPDAALAAVRQISGAGPAILADTQDNPGGGGAGDTTDLLKAMVAAKVDNAALAIMIDPEAAAAAHAAGTGATIDLALGGRHGPDGVTPLAARFEVRTLSNGRFRGTGQIVGGRDIDLGPSAVLRLGGIDIVTASNPMQPYDPMVFGHLGLDAARYDLLALKSSVHFRADFEPMARAVLLVRAPGRHRVDLDRYSYRNLRAGVRLGPLGLRFEPRLDDTGRPEERKTA